MPLRDRALDIGDNARVSELLKHLKERATSFAAVFPLDTCSRVSRAADCFSDLDRSLRGGTRAVQSNRTATQMSFLGISIWRCSFGNFRFPSRKPWARFREAGIRGYREAFIFISFLPGDF